MLSSGGNVVTSESDTELLQLKEQVKFVDILMAQNAALEGEVTRLCGELDEATKGVLKRGYLHKHRGFYFVMEHHFVYVMPPIL